LDQIYTNFVDGNAAYVRVGVKAALDEGISPDSVLNQELVSAMDEVGKRFEAGEFFVPEMLIADRY
jgi:5-methyltetrahydrofolate--homocysteine methyltransferase